MKKTKISHFNTVWDKNPELITIEDFIESVKTGMINGVDHKPVFDRIRNAGNETERRQLKQGLPAVSLSGFAKTDIK